MKKYRILHYTETDQTIIQQLKEICNDAGIGWKNPWEWITEHISFFYDNDASLYAVDADNDLTCRLCGHGGCGSLWEVFLTSPDINVIHIPTSSGENLQIELPQSILCGSECINISQQLRNIISEIKRIHNNAKILLTNDRRINLDVLMDSIDDTGTLYFPVSLVKYNPSMYRYKTFVSKHSFRWNTKMIHNSEPTMRSNRYTYKRCPNTNLMFSEWCNYCVIAKK